MHVKISMFSVKKINTHFKYCHLFPIALLPKIYTQARAHTHTHTHTHTHFGYKIKMLVHQKKSFPAVSPCTFFQGLSIFSLFFEFLLQLDSLVHFILVKKDFSPSSPRSFSAPPASLSVASTLSQTHHTHRFLPQSGKGFLLTNSLWNL